MLDAALIKECADPLLRPAIVEQFVNAGGSADPLAITVKSGGRLILVEKPSTPEEALEIVRQNIRGSIVRVGLTQLPAGIGVVDPSELKPDLVDPCVNLRMGTAMFSKILRIVARWYGNPTNEDVFPHLFDDAVHAWRTGKFEGDNVFLAPDPGGTVLQAYPPASDNMQGDTGAVAKNTLHENQQPNRADMRIDLTRIGDRH